MKYQRFFLIVSLVLNSVLLLRVYRNSPTVRNSSKLRILELPSVEPNDVKNDTEGDDVLSKTHNYQQQQQPSLPLESQQVIFVGGVPRSGTTLIRAMLDAHPDILCGKETRVIPRILAMRNRWDRSDNEHRRLLEAGMDEELLDKATRAFVNTIILGHGALVPFLCTKDPLVLNYMTDVVRLYPKAKFVLLIRDGRAVAHSIVSRNVTISGVNSRSYLSAAMFWNKVMMRMTRDCDHLGTSKCMEVYYERLVQSPREGMKKLLKFLDVPWHENILRHHDFIDKEILLSKCVYLVGLDIITVPDITVPILDFNSRISLYRVNIDILLNPLDGDDGIL